MQLADVYSSPGSLLLASDQDGQRLGCVGLRVLDDRALTGEVRRLFVRPAGRGTGLGRALASRLIHDAKRAGLRHLVLNTLPTMTEAIALYTDLGFTECAPYVAEPLEDTLYFALDL